MKTITTLEDFISIKEIGSGYICINHHSKQSKIHDVSCRWISKKNFLKKVIDNEGKQGEYVWIQPVMYC
jgi:hypothetical protein